MERGPEPCYAGGRIESFDRLAYQRGNAFHNYVPKTALGMLTMTDAPRRVQAVAPMTASISQFAC